jgi:hypothetical protein
MGGYPSYPNINKVVGKSDVADGSLSLGVIPHDGWVGTRVCAGCVPKFIPHVTMCTQGWTCDEQGPYLKTNLGEEQGILYTWGVLRYTL